ncbi:MAG: hypothetical protein KGK16_16315 [Bradyrhizobium sp.]|uniref:hypothetical protein n=1 Tax=Bradyrhizobium sp. TaxID=376 RepID=UPI001ED5F476|nr:hypothetical protein [Bradyrhizobium sp.]MBU6457599.1 hypothetical protein [Bradyrhizobium sp.]MDE2332328.1 hypothetical protein [Bradyrhizobium sp.]MDE2602826.1 hypothetical protein [Bradyrhizobium sp.]
MAGIMSILQSAYAATPQSLIAPGSKFANVDPTKWQGTWTGTDDKRQDVTVSITKVSGFRANVTVNDATDGLQSARAFITTTNTFRIGNSQFRLTGDGKAKLITIVTDPTTGNQSALTVPLTRKS